MIEAVRAAFRAAPTRWLGFRFLLEYAALRLWGVVINCFPIETNLRTARLMGRCWWLLMKRHRDRAVEHLRFAFPEIHDERRLRKIARQSFEHFAQLYLVELAMTPRLVHLWSWPKYVELEGLGPALRELLRDRGVIMLTAHFGNYELMGFTITRLGLPLTAVMRRPDNPLLNDFLVRTRRAGGLELLDKKGAMENAGDVLGSGGALCFIADQDAGRKGIFVDFFHKPASWYKSIALLAIQHNVPVVVGTAARPARRHFRYRITVERIIQPEEWSDQPDPVTWITTQYARGLETAIARHPEQYLWVHRRWKSQPGMRRKKKTRKQPAEPAP